MSSIHADTSISPLRNTVFLKGSSSIGNHIKEQHETVLSCIYREFKISRKCQSKFDCLIYEMIFIKELKPTLNKQSDSIRAEFLF